VQETAKLRTWSLLNLFAGSPVSEMLNGPLIDSVENTIALEKNHHEAIGAMLLWFTERPVQPRYPTGIFILVS
jgi:hypothetical protein